MPDTEIPQDVRELARKVVGEMLRVDSTVPFSLATFEEAAERAIVADRASRAPDPSRDGLVEALRPFANMLPDSYSTKNAMQAKLQEWCRNARAALSAIEVSK